MLDCQAVTPQKVGFLGAQTIARLWRRVRRKGKKTAPIPWLLALTNLKRCFRGRRIFVFSSSRAFG